MESVEVRSDKQGLSPRVRGNRSQTHTMSAMAGSIPACAGEPFPDTHYVCYGWVYPRVCGGTTTGNARKPRRWGLSPRVRGNRLVWDRLVYLLRSIPACAGEPQICAVAITDPRVYPRVCGGTPLLWALAGAGAGLSPRVRGNRVSDRTTQYRLRSIPACAGEPLTSESVSIFIAVYPRVCGGTHGIASPFIR